MTRAARKSKMACSPAIILCFSANEGRRSPASFESLALFLDEYVRRSRDARLRRLRADLPALPPPQGGAGRSDGDAWIGRDHRYAEKLATPDVSVADFDWRNRSYQGCRRTLPRDEETIHYGLIPRINRGIFAINELPDLTEKVQVGLFNLMEEKDVQIKATRFACPSMWFFARARIRGLHLARAHHNAAEGSLRHPDSHALSEDAGAGNRGDGTGSDATPESGMALRIPQFVKRSSAQITFEARGSNEINQSSGVCARIESTISNRLLSNAEKARRRQRRERSGAARVGFSNSLLRVDVRQNRTGVCRRGQEGRRPIERLINRAVLKTFESLLQDG